VLATDITERKLAEEELRASEAKLQTIVENLTEGLAVSDLDGNLLNFNRAALDLHGFATLEEGLQHLSEFVDIFELADMNGVILPVEQWPLARVLRGESVRNLELHIRRIHADWRRIFNFGGTLVRDAGGRPMMAVVTIKDITERKRVEEEIRQLNAELEQRVAQRTSELEAANKELEAFSYSVSHDLRAPLRAVDGFSKAVVEDYGPQLPAQGRRYLETIRQSAQRMGELIDDLLMFSRLSRTPLAARMVDTNRLVNEVLEEIRDQFDGRHVDVRVAALPACLGDPALLKQVWINLLSNAVKFTGGRESAVVEIGSSRDNGDNVFFVRDNGTGFDMKYAGKLFGVFQRLHRAEDFSGTGVGLAIVQRVIHRHGGRVWADAEVDRGASFNFTLGREPNHE
jgi:signal transduction histidine kinase